MDPMQMMGGHERLLAGVAAAVVLVSAGLLTVGGQATDGPASVDPASVGAALTGAGWQQQGLAAFTTTSASTSNISGIRRLQVRGRSGDRVASLTLLNGITEETARSYLEQRRQEIEGRFQDTPTPYSSVPSRQINCSDALYPSFEQHPSGTIVTNMRAGSTADYPVCRQEAATRRVRVYLLYCPTESTAIELAIYRPLDAEPGNISISCPS